MVHRKSGPGPCGGGTLILTRFAVQGSRSLGLAASVIGLTFLSSFPSPLPAMTLRRLRLTLPAALLLAGLHGQTPPSPAPDAAPVAPVAPDTSLAVPAPVASAEAPPTPPVAPVASAPSSATHARTLTKEEALKEIDAGLAAFDLTARAERSPVIHAAMMTRLTLLRQRRADLAKAFSPGRFRAMQASILQEVQVSDKITPGFDPDGGRLRRPLTLDESVNAATSDANRMLALDAARREVDNVQRQARDAAESTENQLRRCLRRD